MGAKCFLKKILLQYLIFAKLYTCTSTLFYRINFTVIVATNQLLYIFLSFWYGPVCTSYCRTVDPVGTATLASIGREGCSALWCADLHTLAVLCSRSLYCDVRVLLKLIFKESLPRVGFRVLFRKHF